jgi:hypothetical protein
MGLSKIDEEQYWRQSQETRNRLEGGKVLAEIDTRNSQVISQRLVADYDRAIDDLDRHVQWLLSLFSYLSSTATTPPPIHCHHRGNAATCEQADGGSAGIRGKFIVSFIILRVLLTAFYLLASSINPYGPSDCDSHHRSPGPHALFQLTTNPNSPLSLGLHPPFAFGLGWIDHDAEQYAWKVQAQSADDTDPG